jgi:hypothetical protein
MVAQRHNKERPSATLESALQASPTEDDNGREDEAASNYFRTPRRIRTVRSCSATSSSFSQCWRLKVFFFVALFLVRTFVGATDQSTTTTTTTPRDVDEPVCQVEGDGNRTAANAGTAQRRMVHADCRIVMAPSTLGNGSSGWGVFALYDMNQGQPVMSGDIVIQLTDLAPDNIDPGMQLALHDYSWSTEETGGFYEGVHTVSVIPGIGMLANGMEGQHNVLPARTNVDEAGLTRMDSAGAGSVTHYHNFTFFVQKSVAAGNEILLNYGSNWFRERQNRLHLEQEHEDFVASRDVAWLRQHGQCLDNLQPSRSALPDAGRGVVATRSLEAGMIVAPVPVLPVQRDTLQLTRQLERDGSTVHTQQLFLNYCLGHNKSSLLLYPYSPMVKYVVCVGMSNCLERVSYWSQRKSVT